MNKNIDLGSFQWDTKKITDNIASNRIEMMRLADVLKDTKKGLTETRNEIDLYDSKIESQNKAQERLKKQLQQGYITQEKYNSEISKSDVVIEDFKRSQNNLAKTQYDYIKIITETENKTKELRQDNAELNKLIAAGRTELSGLEGVYRNTNTEMNAYKIEAKNMGIQLEKLRQEGKENTDEYKALAVQFAETSAKGNGMNDVFKKVDKSVGDNTRTVGDYKDQIKSAASEITLGLNQMANGNIIGGLRTIQTGIGGITVNLKALWVSMLSNPITALLVGFTALASGIALGVKEIFDYNKSIKENIALVENLTGTTGQLADDIRLRASAMSETFGDEFNEIVKTANVLSKQLGISFDEAFNKIEEGYIRGANANGDFLERLREYAPLLEKYGFDINEIIALQVQAQQQGIFNDKFEDSLKEAGLSLEEFTKTQSDVLTSAFGKEFSDKISQGINSGALSVKDALLLMSNEAQKRGLSVQQWGILTADVFKEAGEDAGGAKVVLDNVYDALVKSKEPLTELQQLTGDLSQANYELAKAKDEALKSDTILKFTKEMEILWVKSQIVWYGIVDAIIEAVKWFGSITGYSEILGETWDEVVNYATTWWNAIQNIVDVFNDLFDALGLNNDETKSITKSFFQFINPLNQVKMLIIVLSWLIKGFSNFIEQNRVNISAFAITAKNVLGQVYDAAMSFKNLDFSEGLEKLKNISFSKEFTNARKEAEKIVALNKSKKLEEQSVEKAEKELNSGKTQAQKDAEAKAAEEARKKAEAANKQAETKRIADAKKAAEEAKKLLEAEHKRSLEIAKEKANQQADIAKTELAEYIAVNAEKLKDEKRLTAEKVRLQKEYYDEVQKKQQDLNSLEENSKIFAIQQKIDEINAKKNLNQNDLNERKNLESEIENIKKEYDVKDIEIQNQTNEKKKEIDKNFKEQNLEDEKLRKAIKYQQDLIDLEERSASEYEVKKEISTQQREQDLAELENQRVENLISLDNYEAQKKLIEDIYRQTNKKLNQEVEISKRSDAANTFGQVSQLLGQETTVGKAAAIAEVGMNGINAVQNAYTTAQKSPITTFFPGYPIVQAGLAAAFSAKQAAKIAGFEDGGIVADGFPIIRANGDNRLITAKTGEVILNERQQEALGGASIFKMIGVPGFSNGGVVGIPSSNISTVQNSINVNQDYSIMASVISNAVMEGAAIGTHSGSQSGISDLSQNKNIATGANF